MMLSRAREHFSPDASAQQLICLLAVHAAGSAGLEQGQLVVRHGISRSHVSKTVADLCFPTKTRPSLVRSDLDPADRRHRILTCTPEGVALCRTILGEKP